jgi:6-phosphogluconolactonase (cycloisomerase 2 family)
MRSWCSAVGKHDGQLTLLQRRSVEGDHPREFALDPSGNFLLVANQKSNQIVVMRRDPRRASWETVQTLTSRRLGPQVHRVISIGVITDYCRNARFLARVYPRTRASP